MSRDRTLAMAPRTSQGRSDSPTTHLVDVSLTNFQHAASVSRVDFLRRQPTTLIEGSLESMNANLDLHVHLTGVEGSTPESRLKNFSLC